MLWGSRLWRIILARKKLLSLIGLAYIVITLAAYNRRLLAIVASEVSTVTRFYGNATVDTHLEDENLGHTGEIAGEYFSDSSYFANHDFQNGTVIAIGTAITSKKATEISVQNITDHLQVFTTLLPSFCSTVSTGYNFQFYFAYDKTDPVFTNSSLLQAFQKAFSSIIENQCPKGIEVGIHFVQCSHTGKPTWAQNDAMLEAYLDNVDYFYRVNDDTNLKTKGWVEKFLKTLRGYDPPNVGVVGPNHSGGNTGILTYDFVHRTHVDIFGFYYPKLFTDWWGDDWVTDVYKPGRSTKLRDIHLAHTMKLGRRYEVHHSVGGRLHGQLNADKMTLRRYLQRTNSSNTTIKPDGKKVIAMSLFGKNPKHTWGAIRNAQLMPIVFPQWILRIYVPHPEFIPPKAKTTRIEAVPRRILSKLRQLGSDIVFVRAISDKIPPRYWRYLVTMDKTVEYFLVRDADSRISDRDSAAVNDWMQETDVPAIHCVRDHPKHSNLPIVDGLWGGKTSKLRSHLNSTNLLKIVQDFYTNKSSALTNYSKHNKENTNSTDKSEKTSDILNEILWSMLSDDALCHDSVSCEKWKNTRSFPVKREQEEYLGQKFDERQESISNDVGMVKSLNPLCNGKGLYPSKNNTAKT